MKMDLKRIVLFSVLGMFSIADVEAAPRGKITSRPCPFNCVTAGLDRNSCRDWTEGVMCFVEDLHPGAKKKAPEPALPKNTRTGSLGNSGANIGSLSGAKSGSPFGARAPGHLYNSGAGECDNLRPGYFAPPRVFVYDSRPDAWVFSDKVRVQGTIQGQCIVDAGYFEDGQKVQSLKVYPSRRFNKFYFDFHASTARYPEIRALSSTGDVEIYKITDNSSDRYGRDSYERYRFDRERARWDERDSSYDRRSERTNDRRDYEPRKSENRFRHPETDPRDYDTKTPGNRDRADSWGWEDRSR